MSGSADIVPKWSALSFRGRTICYEIKNGAVASARELGHSAELELTPELLAAIDADLQRQAAKMEQA